MKIGWRHIGWPLMVVGAAMMAVAVVAAGIVAVTQYPDEAELSHIGRVVLVFFILVLPGAILLDIGNWIRRAS